MSEDETTDTFTVVLNAQPVSDVVISVASGDTGEATVSASSLTFTNGNWYSAQTINLLFVGINFLLQKSLYCLQQHPLFVAKLDIHFRLIF